MVVYKYQQFLSWHFAHSFLEHLNALNPRISAKIIFFVFETLFCQDKDKDIGSDLLILIIVTQLTIPEKIGKLYS